MRISIHLWAVLASLASPVLAQNPIATPAGKNFETLDGSDQLARGWNIGYAYQFADGSAGHYQNIDDELNGRLRILKSVAYRMDNKSHTTSSALGRTWSGVTLKMAEVNYANVSTTFSNNMATPTTVFSGSVNWPSYTGWVGAPQPPAAAPIQSAHTFPFAGVWVYSGNDAIVHDYVFTGGVLANNGPWTSNSSYHLDGAIIVTSMGTGAARFPSTATCHDSAISGTTTATAAQMVTQYNQYSQAYPGVQNNTIEVPISSLYTAPGAPVIHGVGLAAFNNGVGIPIGFACNNLILDVTAFIALGTTAGPLPKAETPRLLASGPRNAVNLGVDIWMQGVWTDSVTGQTSLTTASRASAPNLGMTEVLPRKTMVSSLSTTSPSGTRASHANWTALPLTFYGQ